MKERQKALANRMLTSLSLFLSLSGFRLRRDSGDAVSVQGFLKRSGDKTTILNLSYIEGGFGLPLGGRKKLLNEALAEALEKAGEAREASSAAYSQEIKEIFVYLTGASDALSGVFSRQGGFFWRPLSKAPGAS